MINVFGSLSLIGVSSQHLIDVIGFLSLIGMTGQPLINVIGFLSLRGMTGQPLIIVIGSLSLRSVTHISLRWAITLSIIGPPVSSLSVDTLPPHPITVSPLLTLAPSIYLRVVTPARVMFYIYFDFYPWENV